MVCKTQKAMFSRFGEFLNKLLDAEIDNWMTKKTKEKLDDVEKLMSGRLL